MSDENFNLFKETFFCRLKEVCEENKYKSRFDIILSYKNVYDTFHFSEIETLEEKRKNKSSSND